ncbi:type I-C CRISPR-associated protein Cas7/Csd2 [Spiractinospora alimapuensis]|uniref:type I-C CRISPR-associated protein Cas7/Csd2 n=1 Tax=Spiractinospora alimapuensis TaxID=2820884 RepID=UPI001F17C4ED|nr:type I-C CRISPR-associated protein Cas7/Csd2 [Spiractinospora alimapuensis]QVQ53394.1 type I-C CRISPR-associated protein Cas7/Csd2 [Spiractinospora alimapuensis]
MSEPHLDPTRKHDFVFLFDVRDGNPNGDPDSGGAPRTDPDTGQGLVTDVAIKRKIRNTIALLKEGEPGFDIYVEAGVALNTQHERAYTALNLQGDKKDKKQTAENQPRARDWMCATFFDVRMFGAVMSTGDKPAGRVQGPLQLTFSRSISPILGLEHGITRITQTRAGDVEQGETTEMGNKHTVPYGLYRGIGHFSAPLAAKTGVTTADLDALWQAITMMFEHDRSASRGEMALRGLYVFSHDNAFGKAPAHQLTDLVQVVPNEHSTPIRAFTDYQVTVDQSQLPPGVTMTTLTGAPDGQQ